jgi:hypothetical protein
MRVNRGVPGSSSEAFPLTVFDVLPVALDIPLSQAKIKDEDLVGGLAEPHAEVVRLYVPMDEVPIVDVLYPRQHLVSQQEHSLEGEPSECLFK